MPLRATTLVHASVELWAPSAGSTRVEFARVGVTGEMDDEGAHLAADVEHRHGAETVPVLVAMPVLVPVHQDAAGTSNPL